MQSPGGGGGGSLGAFLNSPLGSKCQLMAKVQTAHLSPSAHGTHYGLQFVLEDQARAVIIATASLALQSQLLGADSEASMRTEAGRGKLRFVLEAWSSTVRGKLVECVLQSAEAPPEFGGQCYYLLELEC